MFCCTKKTPKLSGNSVYKAKIYLGFSVFILAVNLHNAEDSEKIDNMKSCE